MNKETERQIGLLHAGVGLVVGILTGMYYHGEVLSFLGVIAVAMMFSYPLMPISKKLFNLPEKEFQFKEWLGKGFFMFFGVWILAWTFVHNMG